MLLAWSITAGRGGAGAGSDGKTGGTIVAENQNSNRKNENVRRANRIIQTRSFVLMILMGVVMFVLLFFRLGDFYEMFEEDARIASRELDLTLTSRDHAKD